MLQRYIVLLISSHKGCPVRFYLDYTFTLQIEPEEGSKGAGDDGMSVPPIDSDIPLRPQTASRKLNQQERGRIMKQRMKEKKIKRSAQEEEEDKQEE